jgi:hypothetical protein
MSATYDARINELRGLLGQCPAAADDQVNEKFENLIKRYNEVRQSALDDLVDFMAKASISNLGTASKWQTRVERFRSECNEAFASAARDVMLPGAHQLFWQTAVELETRFIDALAGATRAPQLMDDLLKHQNDLNTLAGALDDNFRYLLQEDQSIQSDQMRSLKELQQMIESVVSEMDNLSRSVKDNAGKALDGAQRRADAFRKAMAEAIERIPGGEAIAEWLKKQIEDEIKPDGYPDELDEPMKEGLKYVALMIQLAGNRARDYRAVLKAYKELIRKQKDVVLAKFLETRQGVRSYLRDNGLDRAETLLNDARRDLESFVSNVPNSTQRSDAEKFRDENFAKLDIVFKRTQYIDAQFRERYKGAIFSMDEETVEQWAQLYVFRGVLEEIKGKDAMRKLGDIRDALPEQMKQIVDRLGVMDDAINSLPIDVQDVARTRDKDFRAFMRDQIERQMGLLIPALDELKQLLVPSHLDEDFGREELKSMLN